MKVYLLLASFIILDVIDEAPVSKCGSSRNDSFSNQKTEVVEQSAVDDVPADTLK